MRRAPAKPVRACTLRKLCPVSHVTFEAPLRTSHFTLLTALFTLHTFQANRPHTGGTFHRRLQPLDTEKHKVWCSGFLPTTQSMQHSCSHSNAICNYSFKKRIELRTQEQPLVAEHRGGTKRPQPQPPHTRGTFHRRLQPLYTEKRKVSCSGFLPKTKPMQHSCSHSNAICNHRFQNTLQPRTHKHSQSSLKPPLQCGKKKGKPTATAPAAHRRYLSSPSAATLHGKTQGLVLRLPPHNTEHATFMQPFQCDLQPQIPKHPTTTHTQAQPKQLEATVTMRQKKRQTNRNRARRTQEVPFIAGCSHFTRKNTRFGAPASSPQHRACTIHAAIPMRFAASPSKPASLYTHGNAR